MIPKSYDEIKLGVYLDFSKKLLDESESISKAIAIILEMDYDSYMLLAQGHESEIALQFLSVPISANDNININFIFDYNNISYIFLSDLNHLTLGQYIDFSTQLEKYSDNLEFNIDLILAALLTIKDTPYEECVKLLSLDKAREIVRQMPTQQAYNLLFFFWESKRDSQKYSSIFLAEKVDQMIRDQVSLLTISNGMAGQTSWTNSLKMKYLNTMRFINYLAQTYSLSVIGGWKKPLLNLLKPHMANKSYNELKTMLNNIKINDKEIVPNFQTELNKFYAK